MTVETIFEMGVFRPLQPVAIGENQHVTIHLADADLAGGRNRTPPRHAPGLYPDDHPEVAEVDSDYQPAPMKALGTVPARFVFAGILTPPVYRED